MIPGFRRFRGSRGTEESGAEVSSKRVSSKQQWNRKGEENWIAESPLPRERHLRSSSLHLRSSSLRLGSSSLRLGSSSLHLRSSSLHLRSSSLHLRSSSCSFDPHPCTFDPGLYGFDTHLYKFATRRCGFEGHRSGPPSLDPQAKGNRQASGRAVPVSERVWKAADPFRRERIIGPRSNCLHSLTYG